MQLSDRKESKCKPLEVDLMAFLGGDTGVLPESNKEEAQSRARHGQHYLRHI